MVAVVRSAVAPAPASRCSGGELPLVDGQVWESDGRGESNGPDAAGGVAVLLSEVSEGLAFVVQYGTLRWSEISSTGIERFCALLCSRVQQSVEAWRACDRLVVLASHAPR